MGRIHHMNLIGSDIETAPLPGHETNPAAGLDPRTSFVTTISFIDDHDNNVTFDNGSNPAGEHDILTNALRWLSSYPGRNPLLVTWNGLFFDLPYLQHRYQHRHHNDGAITLDTCDTLPHIEPKYGWPDHTGTTRWNYATWAGFDHWDIAPDYKPYATQTGTRHSLDPIATHAGFPLHPTLAAVKADRANAGTYPPELRTAYCLSDAHRALQLAQRLITAHSEHGTPDNIPALHHHLTKANP